MSANPGVYDGMTIYRGTTFTRTFTYKDANGDAIDLTGWEGEFKAKASLDADDAVIDLTESPDIELGGPAGTIVVTVEADATDDIAEDELVYSLKITSGDTVVPLLIGHIPVVDIA